VLLALVALTVILGVAPTRLIALREPAVELLLQQIYHGASAPPHEAESRR
jgi:NADH:ubiquinone oxidoreductase subunit 4 (subunit M)